MQNVPVANGRMVKSEKRGYMNWAGWRSHKKIDIK